MRPLSSCHPIRATPQASAASSLLADALAPEEWATFRHIMMLMRTALEPDHAAANGLTLVAVAALLAEAWFPPLPPFGAAGTPTRPSPCSKVGWLHTAQCAAQQRDRIECSGVFGVGLVLL